MDYKGILHDVLELYESVTVIRGYADMVNSSITTTDYSFLNITEDHFWVVMGKDTTEMILEALNNHEEPSLDCEGEYEFSAILKWVPGEWDNSGNRIARDYLEIQHIEFNFIQTFKQRERQLKLNSIIDDDPFNQFFKMNYTLAKD